MKPRCSPLRTLLLAATLGPTLLGCKDHEAPAPPPAPGPSVASAPSMPPAPAPSAAAPAGARDGGAAIAAARPDGGAATKCPSEMAPIPSGGCIDRWEASAGKGALGSAEGKGVTMKPVSATGRMPLVGVSLHQARAMCKNAGKHLCDEREWVSACKGERGWRYPYGNEFEPNRCNDWEHSEQGHKFTIATGSLPNCVTPTGVYDLANNAGEWIEQEHPKLPVFEVRGGTYNMTIADSECDEDDYHVPATAQTKDIGFRCCK